MCRVSSYRHVTLISILFLFVLKSLLPFGVMPAFSEGQGFTLEICQGSDSQISSEAKQVEKALASLLGETQDHPEQDQNDGLCTFATHVQGVGLFDVMNVQGDLFFSTGHIFSPLQDHILLRNISRSFGARAPPSFV